MLRRRRCLAALLVLACLALAPVASAGWSPALYYLDPPVDAVGTGGLTMDEPEGEQPSSAVVSFLPADQASASFVGLEGPNATHLKGRVLVGLWADLSMAQGNLSGRLVFVDAEGAVSAATEGGSSVSTDPESVPEPTALLPPDPSDPQAAAFYLAGQAAPLVMRPPVLLDLGLVDVEVPEGAVAGLELRLVDDGAADVPASGLARVQYAAATTPSFVYVPWWSPDPPAEAPPASSGPAPSSGPSGSSGGGSSTAGPSEPADEEPAGKDSPSVGLVVMLGALAGAALVARRR